MATIGLSHPYIARYTAAGTAVSYTAGRLLGKATELSIELNDAESNLFYADNGPAESDDRFSGGSLTVKTDDLRPQAMIGALGVTSEAISAAGVTTPGAAWLVNDDNQSIPYLGFGGIAKKIVNGETKYVGIVLDKIKFSNQNEAITTQGETITWQTPELKGQIFRSDAASHKWRRISTPLDSEAEADAAVRAYLNIAEAAVTPTLSALSIGTLTLSPTFASNKTAYTTTTTSGSNAVNATASNADDTIEIKVNGSRIANGGNATWVTGTNTVEIAVTNSGGAQIVYIVTVTKTGA